VVHSGRLIWLVRYQDEEVRDDACELVSNCSADTGHDERVPIRSLGIAAEMILNFLGEVNAHAAKNA
jgi:hypothetical protein